VLVTFLFYVVFALTRNYGVFAQMKSGKRPRLCSRWETPPWAARVWGDPAVPKHCRAGVRLGMRVGKVGKAEHGEKLPHVLLTKTLK